MDKSWIDADRDTEIYHSGVQLFLKFAEVHAKNLEKVPCPCCRCINFKFFSISVIRGHLYDYGFSLRYRVWLWHGEEPTSSSNFISPDVESETVNMCQTGFDDGDYDEDSYEFNKFVNDAQLPLYESSQHTKLESLVELYNLKARYNMSDTCFSDLLKVVGTLLPEDNVLPRRFYEAKKTLNNLGLQYDKIHACPKDCILYRVDYADATSCPTCGLSRWKVTKGGKVKQNQPAKVLWYLPVIPRFKRWFKTAETSELLNWHEDHRIKDEHMRHPADSPAWKLVDCKWPEFASESRNLRLALSSDGINPHGSLSSRYSCWPVILVTYNLPPWLCMKRKFMLLSMLISGPKQPGNDIDVYLQPLIEDLQILWNGVPNVFDALKNELFTLRAILLWTINDFPAYGNLAGCSTKGFKACPICGDNTSAIHLPHSYKMSFSSHRKFLPRHHPYRTQRKAFNNKEELEHPPIPLSGEEVLKRVDLIHYVYGKKKKKGTYTRAPALKRKSIFFSLEYWKSLHVRHILDVMHIEKNVCESLLGTLLNIPSKTKDGVGARLDMVNMGIRLDLAPTVGEKKTYLPAAPFTLSRAEKKQVCASFLSMKVPYGHSSNIKNLVSMEELKLFGLKSHDCHTLMQQLLPVAIRPVLPKHVRICVMRFCFFFNELCTKVVDVSKLDKLQSDLVLTLCGLEKIFPPSFFDIMIHLTVHLVREVRLCGPVFYRWMYPFERFMKVLKAYVRNRFRPDASIVEGYMTEESVEFCSEFLDRCNPIGVPKDESKLCGPLSAPKLKPVAEKDRDQAHLHVLFNNDEVDPYRKEHEEHVNNIYRWKNKSKQWLITEHNRTFANWFKLKVYDQLARDPKSVSDTIRWLAGKPSFTVFTYEAYKHNGVRYFTKKRDDARAVQNSGVSVVAKTTLVSSSKDKNPVESDVTFYGVIEEIWELDYQAFKAPLFQCQWAANGHKQDEYGFTLVDLNRLGYKNDRFVSMGHVKQVFYVEDPVDPRMSIVLSTTNRDYRDALYNDDLGDTTLDHQPFCEEIPAFEEDVADEETSYIRDDVEGSWIDEHKTRKEE